MRNRPIIAVCVVCMIVAAASSTGCSQTSAQPTPPATETAAAPSAMPSKAFHLSELEIRPSDTGEIRPLFRSPTATLDELEMHATTLNPGQRPHPPHQHPYEELVVLREGTLEATVNDRVIALSAGSVLFIAPNDLHGWQNKGETPAKYFIITWRTPRTAAAR